jgi:hypothetical protein
MAQNIRRDQSNTPVIAGVDDLDDTTPHEPRVDHSTRELYVKSTTGVDPFYTLREEINSVDSDISYLGLATPGTADSAASWLIFEVTETDSSTTMKLADGDSSFNNVWDDRESLTYS